MDKVLLKPAEAGDLIGVGRSNVYRLIREGVIPTVRVGGLLRVPVAALHRLAEEQRAVGGAG